MKHYLLFVVIILLWSGCRPVEEERYNGWPNYFLEGKVRSIQSSYYDADASGNIGWKWQMGDERSVFDRDGNLLVEYTSLTDGDPEIKAEYIYQEGKLQEIVYSYEDEIRGNIRFEHENNVIVRSVKQDPAGTQQSVTYYAYDKDKISSIKEYNPDQQLIVKTTYHYTGNVLSYKLTEYPLSAIFSKAIYDEKGKVEVETQGGEIEDGVYIPTGSHTYEYLYDETGNWIQYTAFENGQAEHIQKRTIEYF